MLLDGQLGRAFAFCRSPCAGADLGERLGFQHQIIAYPAATPVLPAFEASVLGLHRVDTSTQRTGRCAFFQRLIDSHQILVGFGEMPAGQCDFGFLHNGGKRVAAFILYGILFIIGLLALAGLPGFARTVLCTLPLFKAGIECVGDLRIGDRGQSLPAIGCLG